MEANFIERLQQFMTYKGLNDNQITVEAKLSIGLINKAKKSGKAINLVNVEKILLTYPELNSDWLLTGRGNMLNVNDNEPMILTDEEIVVDTVGLNKFNKSKREAHTTETRPRIPYDAAAGSLSIGFNGVTAEECEQIPVIPSFPRYDFTIFARGDSMTPDFMSGDELACAFVKEQTFIQWGRPHILDTAQGIVLKKIFPRADSILCRSVNTDYPDFEVPKSDIYRMALVVGLIRHL